MREKRGLTSQADVQEQQQEQQQAAQRTHFCCVFVCFSFKGPIGPLLSQDQVLLGQLQGELGYLQPGLVQLGVGMALTGAQLSQLPAQTLGYMITGLQTLLQAVHLQQSSLVLRLQGDKDLGPDIVTRTTRRVELNPRVNPEST